jgi:hypothetical protein
VVGCKGKNLVGRLKRNFFCLWVAFGPSLVFAKSGLGEKFLNFWNNF